MIYWQKIPIPRWEIIRDKTLDFIYTTKFLDKFPRGGVVILDSKSWVEHCPEVLTSLESYDNTVVWAALHIAPNFEPTSVHMDYQGKQNECRINIPLINCEGSITEYYTGGQYHCRLAQGYREQDEKKMEYATYYEVGNTAVKVDEFTLDSPTLLRVKVPHRVVPNNINSPRISLSMYPKYDMVHILEKQL